MYKYDEKSEQLLVLNIVDLSRSLFIVECLFETSQDPILLGWEDLKNGLYATGAALDGRLFRGRFWA